MLQSVPSHLTAKSCIRRSASLAVCAVIMVLLGACEAPIERTAQYDPRIERATMDLFLPGDDHTGRPGILMVHGGGWRKFDSDQYRPVARRFARSGYVTASVNYRLVPAGVFPNAVHDVACSLAWFQNHAGELGMDPARIAVMGYSAGGHLATLVSVAQDPELLPDCAEGAPERPAAIVSGAGGMDLRELRRVDAVRDFLGGRERDIPEVYELASPLLHASADDPPMLFVHGRWDIFVSIEQSRAMRDALTEVGVEANLLELGGSGHLFNPTDDGSSLGIGLSTDAPEAWIAVVDFLDRHIGQP